jgi:glycosyltransferase involved in cell wall biosynthesis
MTLAPVRRVAMIAESFLPKVDGVSKTSFLTMRYLQQTGREVVVFAPDLAPRAIGDVRVVPLPSFGLFGASESRIALPHPILAQQLAAFKPDLIHLCSPALLSLGAVTLGRQNRIPIVANYQTDLPAYANHYRLSLFSQAVRDTLRYLHNRCHITLVPSRFTARQLQEAGFHRLRRWGRGVDSERFSPAHRSDAWRARLLAGRDPRSLLCIFVGRLANEKRVDLLLEVARTPGVALTIIGDGHQRAELEARFAGSGAHFHGYLFGDDLASAYASSDVFMFSGVAETFGQVVQEAMASGLPCVVVNQGGVVDLVEDGVNGVLCPPDPQAFARAAQMLRDREDVRLAMGARSRAIAEANPWSAVLAQLETHYSEAVALNARLNRLAPHTLTLLDTIAPPWNTFSRKAAG